MSDESPEALPAAVVEWLEARSLAVRGTEPLAGDLGTRRYLRLRLAGGDPVVLALYPPRDTACARFLRSHELLAAGGVATPEILDGSCEDGWMLLEDVGPTWFEERAESSWTTLRPVYEQAVEAALAIRDLPRDAVAALNPALDGTALTRELRLTWDLVLVPEGLAGEGPLAAELWAGLVDLCERLGDEPSVPAHRDFMVRNLVAREDRLIVLDHQDLRLAPPAYDLASLFNDSLFPPPQEAMELAIRALGCEAVSYRRAVVQRCLKAVGSYRRAAGQGKPGREKLVRPTLARAWAELPHVPEVAPLRAPLSGAWLEALSPDRRG